MYFIAKYINEWQFTASTKHSGSKTTDLCVNGPWIMPILSKD